MIELWPGIVLIVPLLMLVSAVFGSGTAE